MKTVTITKATNVQMKQSFEDITKTVLVEGEEEMTASDGYHTFEELYDHRITLYIALCKHKHDLYALENPGKHKIWRSKVHSDGSIWDGWFILGIGTNKGEQITYHLPLSRWEETYFVEEIEKAPEWDGHTPEDVLERIKAL